MLMSLMVMSPVMTAKRREVPVPSTICGPPLPWMVIVAPGRSMTGRS
jgi:hypothetical protein